MNKKQSKRQRDIKTKLMAAICMLLVSSIMMVSTTYAWFTLSTAPEVTGINTAVGSNGNLEMALLPLHGDASKITSGTADSMAVQPAKVSNITWGNLVKLDGTGDNSYGLEQITLYPSALNSTVVEGENVEKITMDAPLKTPEYGADGRVAKLQPNTSVGVYSNGGFYKTASGKLADGSDGIIATPYGVRGIGTVSGMSPRNLAFNLALSNANNAALSAKSTASVTLNNNGSTLANVAITRVTDETATYTQEQVNAMTNVLNDVLNGTLVHIENALKNYIVAASIAPTTADSTYEALTTAIMEASVADLADGKVEGAVVSTNMETWIGKVIAMRTTVQDARDGLPTGKTEYTWEEIRDPMSKLIDSSKLDVNGYKASEIKDKLGDIAGAALTDGIKVNLPSGSGVFSDIADFAGNYSAEISLTNLKYGTTVIEKPIPAQMNIVTEEDPTYLELAAAAVADAFDDGGNTASDNPITDFYGFVVDLAFRTNAANSWLQLQQTAVDRIYTDGTNTNTMGHGATMTFEISDTVNFPGESVKRLMGAIKIVLFDPSAGNEIISYAKLDTTAVDTTVANKVTMPLVLCDKAGNVLTSETNEDAPDPTIGIMPLNQNQTHQLSVLVYLDGENVGNDDVPVAGAMKGSMNLQFSSSATLTPMQYADLKAGDGGALNGNNTPASPEATVPPVTGTVTPDVTIDPAVTDLTADKVSDVALTEGGFGFTIDGYNPDTHVVTVTINGGTSVTANYEGTGFVVVTGETVNSVEISIAAK